MKAEALMAPLMILPLFIVLFPDPFFRLHTILMSGQNI